MTSDLSSELAQGHGEWNWDLNWHRKSEISLLPSFPAAALSQRLECG